MIILSVNLAVCVVLLLMCGCVIFHLKQKKAAQSKVENIDANPDYGEEQYATAVVDNNDYYDYILQWKYSLVNAHFHYFFYFFII